jgi:[ribosomal protein S18]-alanine N-acetyltransferase
MKIENRADACDIELWAQGFDIAELATNGWSLESLLKLTSDFPAFYLFVDSKLAACFIYQQIDVGHFEVLFLGTRADFRRKGLQEVLLAHFLKFHKTSHLWLECRADNHPAICLYSKLGFTKTGLRPRYYKDGMDAILMNFSEKIEP